MFNLIDFFQKNVYKQKYDVVLILVKFVESKHINVYVLVLLL